MAFVEKIFKSKYQAYLGLKIFKSKYQACLGLKIFKSKNLPWFWPKNFQVKIFGLISTKKIFGLILPKKFSSENSLAWFCQKKNSSQNIWFETFLGKSKPNILTWHKFLILKSKTIHAWLFADPWSTLFLEIFLPLNSVSCGVTQTYMAPSTWWRSSSDWPCATFTWKSRFGLGTHWHCFGEKY